MKKLLILIPVFFTIIMAGCQNKVNVGDLTLGQSQEETISTLESLRLDLDNWNDSTTGIDGELNLLGIEWNKSYCTFKEGKLVEIAMSRPFSTLSRSSIEALKERLESLCGEGFNTLRSGNIVVAYGCKSDNNGCIGGTMIVFEDDVFFATIKLAK